MIVSVSCSPLRQFEARVCWQSSLPRCRVGYARLFTSLRLLAPLLRAVLSFGCAALRGLDWCGAALRSSTQRSILDALEHSLQRAAQVPQPCAAATVYTALWSPQQSLLGREESKRYAVDASPP